MKVLVANRGEIACRVIRTCQELGHETVAVYSDVDAEAPHVQLADHAVALGEPRSYLDSTLILEAAAKHKADLLHPGYGFLSENAEFARACREASVTLVGPPPEAMEVFGDKRAARALAEAQGVPVVPGAQTVDSVDDAKREAARIGYPVLLKAAGGGGGKGMRQVHDEASLGDAFAAATREAENAFNDGRLLIEKYVFPARHVEVQILGNGKKALAVGDRECSLQRRYQKVVEEAPSIGITEETRQNLYTSASTLLESASYRGAGTVEFLVGPDGDHYFLEVNARLQVEHPVTELVSGLDLVAWQLSLTQSDMLPEHVQQRGHAIEVRLNAENAYEGFLPATGHIRMLEWPTRPGLRVDSGIQAGGEISPYYDSMIAKVVASGEDRETARRKLLTGLREAVILGLVTNQAFLIDVLGQEFFVEGKTFTTTLENEEWSAPELPEAIAEWAKQQGGIRRSLNATNQGADAHSPFATMEGFRIGQ